MIRNPTLYIAYFIIVFSLVFFLSGCFKDDFNDISIPGWNPEVAFPLINAEFKVYDIISKFETGGYIKSDSDGLLYLVYTGEVVSIKGQDLYKLTDLLFSFSEQTFNLKFPFEEGEVISKINLSSGNLYYELSTNENGDVQVVLKIPAAIKDGIPFQESVVIPSHGTSSQEIEGIIDLDGYTLDLTQADHINELQIVYEALNLENNQPVILEKFTGKFADLLFDLIEGQFGNKNLGEYLDTLKLDVFKNWVGGSIFLEEPKIRVDIKNSFGFPLTAHFTNFDSKNKESFRTLEGEIISNGMPCDFPGVPKYGNLGRSTYLIDPSNSNLRNFLAISPQSLTYGLSIFGDTKIDLTHSNFFITDTSYLKVNLDVEMPLHARIENVYLVDTFNFQMKARKRVESANFKLLIENSFPNDAEVQVFFTTGDYIKIDSLLTPLKNIFSSASVDENGFTINSTIEETHIPFSKERYKRLFDAEKILVRVKLVSFNKDIQSVKYTLENGLSVKMGVIAGLTQ